MLRKSHRFHGYSALNFVHQKGQVARAPGLSLKYIHNNRQNDYRVAVVVSKKVSKSAVVRNRLRRRIYEAYRLQTALHEPYDLVFMVYDVELAVLPTDELQRRVYGLLKKASLPTAVSR